jgi:hypothetical protein
MDQILRKTSTVDGSLFVDELEISVGKMRPVFIKCLQTLFNLLKKSLWDGTAWKNYNNSPSTQIENQKNKNVSRTPKKTDILN